MFTCLACLASLTHNRRCERPARFMFGPLVHIGPQDAQMEATKQSKSTSVGVSGFGGREWVGVVAENLGAPLALA